jgi:hypothetical protein
MNHLPSDRDAPAGQGLVLSGGMRVWDDESLAGEIADVERERELVQQRLSHGAGQERSSTETDSREELEEAVAGLDALLQYLREIQAKMQ